MKRFNIGKRITAIFLALTTLLCVVPTAVTAYNVESEGIVATETDEAAQYQNIEGAYRPLPEPVAIDGESQIPKEEHYLASYDSETEKVVLQLIENLIVSAMKPGKFKIDISKYKIDPERINLYTVMYYSPYIANGINITPYYYTGGYYDRIEVECPLNQYEIESYFDAVDIAVEETILAVSEQTASTERALCLHDRLAYYAEYDTERLAEGTIPDDSYRSAGVLVKKIGVCQSYAYAYKYILDKLDIPCTVVTSRAMNHAWNVVKIGANYYHVDVTWDDPTPDVVGRVEHNYFLLSDSAISATRGGASETHYSWDASGIVCGDTYYDNAYWVGSNSVIVLYGNYRYYVINECLVKRKVGSSETTVVERFDHWYTADKKQYWIGTFSGLTLVDGYLLVYNTATGIKCIDVSKSDNAYTSYTPYIGSQSIYYSKVEDGILYYAVGDSPSGGTVYSTRFYNVSGQVTLDVEPDSILMWEGETYRMSVVLANLSGTDYVNYTIYNTDAIDVDNWNVIGKSAGGARIKLSYGKSTASVYVYVLNSSKLYRDVKSSAWYRKAVDHVAENGLMNGTSYYDFEPNTAMNRAMLVTVLWRMAGSPEPKGTTPFGDLKQSWYKKAVAWAYENGIVNGISATKFGPSENITREQMAAIFYRYSAFCGYDTSQSANISGYPDAKKVSKYAAQAMRWANGIGLIQGKPAAGGNILNPKGDATRAEVATILQRYSAFVK